MTFVKKDLTGSFLSDTQKLAIEKLLRFLSSMDDGAFRRDSSGFNLDDTEKANDLAEKSEVEMLTDSEYLWAKDILFKYWRQFRSSLFDDIYGNGAWERCSNKCKDHNVCKEKRKSKYIEDDTYWSSDEDYDFYAEDDFEF